MVSKNKITIKQKDQYLNLEISKHDQKSGLILKTTDLKLIPSQEKYCHHRLFQIYITGEDNPDEIIFHVSIGCEKIGFS